VVPSIDSIPSDLVAGKYQVTRLIGQGGMGSVWEGVHATLGTRVAIKFIDAAFADSDEARSRFENEARAAAKLNSKYAVQVFDHGVMPDGRPFIVMEFLTGEPLDSRLDRTGRLPPAETARIINQVSRALARAHAVGIVHRDLKPENIFLVWDDEDQAHVAKVVDFGIAKFTDAQASGISSSTRTGSVLGTPYYMSPEQARGLRTVDYRSDLWSLGVITYRCMTGSLPFEGEAVGDLLVKICTAPIPVPSQVADGLPPMFDAWFERVMQRDPAMRFASVNELAEQLGVVCGVSRAPMGSSTSEGMAPPPGGLRPGATTPVNVAQLNLTPQTGPVPAYGSQGYGSGAYPPGAFTPNPVMHTPSPGASRPRTGLVVGGGVLGVLLLAGVVGGFVWLGRSEPAETASAAPPPASVAPPELPPAQPLVQAQPAVVPIVAGPAVAPATASTASAAEAPASPPPPRGGRPNGPRPVAVTPPPPAQPPPAAQPVRPPAQSNPTPAPDLLGY